MDRLPLTLAAACVRVDGVQVFRVVDAAKRRAPLRAKVGAGLTVEEFRRRGRRAAARASRPHRIVRAGRVWGSAGRSTRFVRRSNRWWQNAPAIPPGPGGRASSIGCWRARRRRGMIRLDLEMSECAAPDPHDRIVIDGDPPLDVLVRGGTHGDSEGRSEPSCPRSRRSSPRRPASRPCSTWRWSGSSPLRPTMTIMLRHLEQPVRGGAGLRGQRVDPVPDARRVELGAAGGTFVRSPPPISVAPGRPSPRPRANPFAGKAKRDLHRHAVDERHQPRRPGSRQSRRDLHRLDPVDPFARTCVTCLWGRVAPQEETNMVRARQKLVGLVAALCGLSAARAEAGEAPVSPSTVLAQCRARRAMSPSPRPTTRWRRPRTIGAWRRT